MKMIDAEVTAEDIKNGIRRAPDVCPIALAAKRAIEKAGLAGRVRVFPQNIVINKSLDDGSTLTCWSVTDRKQHRFITRFDKGKSVEPFKFVLFYAEAEGDFAKSGMKQDRRSSPDYSR